MSACELVRIIKNVCVIQAVGMWRDFQKVTKLLFTGVPFAKAVAFLFGEYGSGWSVAIREIVSIVVFLVRRLPCRQS